MTGKCSHCDIVFNTKDGGSMCPMCGDIACPECEKTFFSHAISYVKSLTGQPLPKTNHNDVCDGCREGMVR